MEHHFNTEIASLYGIEEAILLHHFYYWIAKNAANESNFNNGLYWTYNSKKAYAKLFCYLNEAKIFRIIKKLEESGLVVKGNFSNNKFDKTNWYAITLQGLKLLKENGYDMQPFKGKLQSDTFDCSFLNDGVNESGQSYTDNNTKDNNTDNRKEKEDRISSSKKKQDAFVPPTLEDVQAYIEEKLYDVDAKYFFDYYEAGDWRCGKDMTKMKSWKQAVVTWQSNNNKNKKSLGETNVDVDDLFYECWKAYGEKGSEVNAKAEWMKLSEKEKTIICRHIEQYTHVTNFCYRKNFENYIGQKEYKNIVRRKNIVIFEPTKGEADNYYPFTDIGFSWNEYYNHFLYIGYDVQDIADGYTKENRPHGATVMANNGRGVFKWDSQKKEWVKEEDFDLPF